MQIRPRLFWFSRWAAMLGLALMLVSPLPAGQAEDEEVDLALVLAIDCSFSVDANEFRQQMEGLGLALQRPEVMRAIHAGNHQRIAVTAMFWSDQDNQMVIIPWSIIAGEADAREVGQKLFSMPRLLAEGGTSISMALLYADALFEKAPSAQRRVIDVSSDGRNNVGPPVRRVRDRVLAQGITVNALAIMNEWPTLDIYFESQVAGGEGHFVIPTADYQSYGEAIYRKLLKEITGPGIS
jgi:hypothetical protein